MSSPDTPSKPAPRPAGPADEKRREFIRSTLFGGAVVGFSLLGLLPVLKAHAARLRPPGALDEREFLAACIKCGQCVQVCPVEAIFLADAEDGVGIGVPYITARDQACDFSCDAIQCVLACPTGALTHSLDKPEQTEMGFARLDEGRKDTCLARQGQGFKGAARDKGLHRYIEIDRWTPLPVAEHKYDLELCDLCVRECPIKDAISLQPMSSDPADRRRTPVVHEPCVGCGMCEMICPVDPPPIVVDARVRPARKPAAAVKEVS